MFVRSQILGQRLKFNKRRSHRLGVAPDRVTQAMIDVVVNQLPLGISDRIFYGMKLLREFGARTSFLHHLNDRA